MKYPETNPTETTDQRLAIDPTQTRKSAIGELLATHRGAQLAEIAIVFSPVPIAMVVAGWWSLENPILLNAAIWIANFIMLGLVWLGTWYRGESLSSIGLTPLRPSISGIGRTLLKSFLILIFAITAFIFGSIVMANITGIPEPADMTQYNFLRGNLPMLLFSLAGVYVASSFGEELVYRGFLITRLQVLFGGDGRRPIYGAIIVSSIIFGFAHFQWGPMGIVQTTFMGAALAVSFFWTKRVLWPLVIAHACMDTILFVQLYLAPG